MSRCAICGRATDLALSDVLTTEQAKPFGGFDKVPLIGTCGERVCIEKQLEAKSNWIGGPNGLR